MTLPTERGATRTCRICGRELPLDCFAPIAGGGRRHVCRDDRRAQNAAHYRANPDQNRAGIARRIAAAQEIVGEHLLANPCADCGESDPVCLDFHHLHSKTLNISQLIFSRRRSLAALRAEMAKCVVLCANCHRRRTLRT
jgi:5-methylcytosine-specific restriction endonuclease McrA